MNQIQISILSYLYEARVPTTPLFSNVSDGYCLAHTLQQQGLTWDHVKPWLDSLFDSGLVEADTRNGIGQGSLVRITTRGLTAFDQFTEEANRPPRGVAPFEWKLLRYMVKWKIRNFQNLPKHFSMEQMTPIFEKWGDRRLITNLHYSSQTGTRELDSFMVHSGRLEHYMEELKAGAVMNEPSHQVRIEGNFVGALATGGNATTGDIININNQAGADLLHVLEGFANQIGQNNAALVALQELVQHKDNQMAVAMATQKLIAAEPKAQNFLVGVVKEFAPKAVGVALFEGVKFYLHSHGLIT